MSITTSRWNSSRKSIARRTTCATASGSSPLTWKIGICSIFATSVAYVVERASLGRRGEADLVVDDDVERAAGGVAVELAQVERLLHDALAGERGVAVDQQRHACVARATSPTRSCLARMRPSTTGLTNSRWLGLKHSDRCTFLPLVGRRSREL